jgi:hypothetical protein
MPERQQPRNDSLGCLNEGPLLEEEKDIPPLRGSGIEPMPATI